MPTATKTFVHEGERGRNVYKGDYFCLTNGEGDLVSVFNGLSGDYDLTGKAIRNLVAIIKLSQGDAFYSEEI